MVVDEGDYGTYLLTPYMLLEIEYLRGGWPPFLVAQLYIYQQVSLNILSLTLRVRYRMPQWRMAVQPSLIYVLYIC